MKHSPTLIAAIAILAISMGISAHAQGMMNTPGMAAYQPGADEHTAQEEAAGKAVWEKLQAKQKTCADLSNDDFETLGEYFMGQMMGSAHEAMNNMMVAMLGAEGEEQMHAVMGKRLSGCDPSAAFPPQGIGFMSMMQMMGGGWPSPAAGGAGRVMGFSYGTLGWLALVAIILWVLWWAAVIVGITVAIRWFIRRIRGGGAKSPLGVARDKPLDILKERYAGGEINKSEFEEMRRTIKP